MTTLPIIKKNIETELVHVNAIISNTLKETTADPLSKIYAHTLAAKGKQIRASLILLISQIKKQENNSNFHKLAAGIELIHLASLIHDDIIDKADIRRNQMTIYKKFNTNNAIISGVHCYALALKLISSIGHIGIIDIISEGVIDLCEGECIQMNQRFNFDLTTDDYWTIIRKKTAALFKAACQCTGTLLDLRKEDINHLSTFGETLGIIFQLSDDYLDIFDNKNTLSKKIMQDLNTGDISLPILLAGEQTKNKTIEEIKNLAQQPLKKNTRNN